MIYPLILPLLSYVSCSECSYDSEACTCTSADRCYCSLGADHDVAAKLEATKKHQQQQHRHSMYSCGTEDKCYCSMTEGAESHSTCCDSDSCISTSKCYCHGQGRKGVAHSHHTSHRSSHSDNNNNYANSEHDSGHNSQQAKGKSSKSCKKGDKEKKKSSKDGGKSSSRRDNLGLDYELFTVSGSKTTKSSGTAGKSVRAHEALSVKKSVEAAAVFADVKLSQTTDISNLVSSGGESTQKRSSSSSSVSGKMNNLNGERKQGNREQSTTYGISKSDMSMMRDKSLMKVRVGGGQGKAESIYGSTNGRPVSASGLEDSLGYLP